jgi:uncharacterized protein (TIGR03067 family)
MRPVFVVLVATVVATGTSIRSLADEAASDLEGKWKRISQQYDGGPSFSCPNSSMTFTRDKMSFLQRRRTISYSYTTDPSATPRKIDLRCVGEPFDSLTFEAIYEVDGENSLLLGPKTGARVQAAGSCQFIASLALPDRREQAAAANTSEARNPAINPPSAP